MSEMRECYLKMIADGDPGDSPAYVLSRELFGTHNKMVTSGELRQLTWVPDFEINHYLKIIGIIWCYSPKDSEVKKISEAFPNLDHIRLCK